jgi:hypothetical protein
LWSKIDVNHFRVFSSSYNKMIWDVLYRMHIAINVYRYNVSMLFYSDILPIYMYTDPKTSSLSSYFLMLCAQRRESIYQLHTYWIDPTGYSTHDLHSRHERKPVHQKVWWASENNICTQLSITCSRYDICEIKLIWC